MLALTDTHSDNRERGAAHVHKLLQMPLNWFGLTVRIRPFEAGEPPDIDPSVTRAVIVHVAEHDATLPVWLFDWLERQRDTPGLRFVHVGSLAALERLHRRRLDAWLGGFGLQHRAEYVDNPLRVGVRTISQQACAFEAAPVAVVHGGPVNTSDDNTPWVTTVDRRRPGDERHPVVTGPWGGLALDPWVASYGTGSGDRRWHLDPFAFFADALAIADQPAPDPSIAWGRRMFLLHVDGDGFESMSTARRERSAADVFRTEIVERYRIPMSLSVIARSLTDDLRPVDPTAEMRLAQQLFATPWVEPASHTVLHPLDWRRRHHARTLPRTVVWYGAIDNYEHSMRGEVLESVAFVNRYLTSPERPCRVLFWSGTANPVEQVVQACRAVDCENLNGGVYRWDRANDSVGYVVPWGLQLGDAFQVYCGAANENVFDGFYTTMPTSFGHIDATIENTGSRRILKPANVYAHFYSAESAARLAALQQLIEKWALRRATVPVFASRYAAAVRGAQRDCRIARIADGWLFEGFDDCCTARLPDDRRFVDWRRSPGVLGANSIGGRRFLQLAAGGAQLVLCDEPVAMPHFVAADHDLRDASRNSRGVSFESTAWRARTVELAGFAGNAPLEVLVDGRPLPGARAADGDGRYTLRLPAGSDELIEVRSR